MRSAVGQRRPSPVLHTGAAAPRHARFPLATFVSLTPGRHLLLAAGAFFMQQPVQQQQQQPVEHWCAAAPAINPAAAGPHAELRHTKPHWLHQWGKQAYRRRLALRSPALAASWEPTGCAGCGGGSGGGGPCAAPARQPGAAALLQHSQGLSRLHPRPPMRPIPILGAFSRVRWMMTQGRRISGRKARKAIKTGLPALPLAVISFPTPHLFINSHHAGRPDPASGCCEALRPGESGSLGLGRPPAAAAPWPHLRALAAIGQPVQPCAGVRGACGRRVGHGWVRIRCAIQPRPARASLPRP